MNRGMVISDYGAVIRKEPDKKSAPVGTLDVFDTVVIVEDKPDWRKIRKGDTYGYIPSKFVSVIGL